MSGKERSKDDVEELIQREDPGKRSEGYGRKIRKAKQLVLSPFTRVKKLYRKKSSFPTNPGKGGCYLCFREPLASDSPATSQTSDPNHPDFPFELLKTLIESSDFYSNECNVHTVNH